MVKGLAERKGIHVAVTGDTDTAAMLDREMLKRAFINIVGNGIRYADLRIVLQVVRSGDHMEIGCTVDGNGFLPGEEAHIFDRFYKRSEWRNGYRPCDYESDRRIARRCHRSVASGKRGSCYSDDLTAEEKRVIKKRRCLRNELLPQTF